MSQELSRSNQPERPGMADPLRSPVFTERVAFLEASQFWPREKLRAYQIRKLRDLIRHVQENVPFYADVLGRLKLTWESFTSLDVLKHLPTIDKRTVQNNYDAFLPRGADKFRLRHRTTGGSTGTPLTIYADDDFFARDKANTEHYMNVFGLDIFNYRSLRLYGDRIDQNIIDKGIYWRTEEGRRLVMSCYHISHETAPQYVAEINRFRPDYIHTRPSAILPLARQVVDRGLTIERPIAHMFCDGEYLTEGQRAIIERAFGGRLHNIFGHTEACVVGHPCPHSERLHYMPQVGILEVLASDGTEVEDPGAKGELVTTGFNNPIFPLLRYRTNDIGVLADQHCTCGRNYRLLERIDGRMQDYVVDRNDNIVPLAPAIFNYNDMDWKDIREFQVVQDRAGYLTFLIQPERNLPPTDEAADQIARRIGAILGLGFSVTARFVDSIEKTAIGKHRYLDQKLDVSRYF